MAIVFVQTTGRILGEGVDSITADFSGLPTVDNHVISMCAGWGGFSPASTDYVVSDNQGNSYATDKFESVGASGYGLNNAAIGSGKVATSAGTFTVVITPTDGGDYMEAVVCEFSGLASASWLDRTGTNEDAVAGFSANAASVTASGANSQADELVAVVLSMSGSSALGIGVPTTGYTERGVHLDSGDTIGFEAATKIVSGSETSSAAWGHNSSAAGSAYWCAVLATYKAAAADNSYRLGQAVIKQAVQRGAFF